MSKRHAREHGRILSVDEETLGSVLVADAASGATTLYVDDAAEFEDDGTGGWLSVNDQVIEYDTVDDDAGTIHLKTGLSAAADDGDPVYVWSKLYDTAATVKTALVMVDGEDENTDPIHATLSDAVQDLPEGLRGEAGEACTLVRVSDDEWEVTAVGGAPSTAKGARAVNFEDQDTFTAGTGGDQTFRLSHRPAKGSVHLTIGGAPQPHTEFTVDYDTGIVTVPDTYSLFESGDWFDFRYAYRATVKTPFLIDWASGGWRYLQVAQGDSTNRSAVGFNDASWAAASAPFGQGPHSDWPAPAVNWPTQTALWLRHDYASSRGKTLTINVRIDNIADVYFNGTKIGTIGTETAPAAAGSLTVDGSLVKATNVVAVRAQDDVQSVGGDLTYFDLQIIEG